jgi:mRNA interferase MazF
MIWTMICKPFEVVNVPFPFTDRPLSKIRKALVLSSEIHNEKNGATILCMITSAERSNWLGDLKIINWEKAGLKKPCIIRLKLFTLDNTLIIEKKGDLQTKDRIEFKEQLLGLMPFLSR